MSNPDPLGAPQPQPGDKALTVCQPYAHLIRLGEKPLENRNWSTSYRGRLWIHAGKSRAWMDDDDLMRYPSMAFGALVCSVVLYDCRRVGDLPPELQGNEHANGPFCLMLRDLVVLLEPIPMRGAQGLWEIQP